MYQPLPADGRRERQEDTMPVPSSVIDPPFADMRTEMTSQTSSNVPDYWKNDICFEFSSHNQTTGASSTSMTGNAPLILPDVPTTLPAGPTNLLGAPLISQELETATANQSAPSGIATDDWEPYDAALLHDIVPSALSLEDPKNELALEDLSFLQDAEFGDAAIHIVSPTGDIRSIIGVDLTVIQKKAPKLAAAFTGIEQVATVGRPEYIKRVCTIHNASPAAVIGLLRGIYQSDYTFCEAMICRPVSLLLHLQVLQLAKHYRADDVQIMATMHVEREIGRAVKSHRPLVDLCGAVRFLYSEMRDSVSLRVMLADYCVANFPQHMILEQEAFRQTAFESPLFHQDLQR